MQSGLKNILGYRVDMKKGFACSGCVTEAEKRTFSNASIVPTRKDYFLKGDEKTFCIRCGGILK